MCYEQCKDYKKDYRSLADSEKKNLGLFVNLLKSSSALLNKEVRLIN